MKEKIYSFCKSLIDTKIAELQLALNAATEAANNETKSSVGDKHETARAMMQLEQEKITKQLNEALDQRTELDKIDISTSSSVIKKGSLVKTDKGFIFLSIGLGKLNIENETVIAVSPLSPLGAIILGLKENDTAKLNSASYLIESIK